MTDVIVVGAGSAGSVVTRRLLDAGASVTLLEAGRKDENPAIHDLARLGELWHGEDDWDYFTTPQQHADNRRIHWPRGKVLGGSHSLNASIYVRGAQADYDRWQAEGATGWAWNDVLPYFKKIENYSGAESELRAKGGLLDVTTNYAHTEIMDSLLEAAQQAGIPYNADYNAAQIEGVSPMQLNLRNGQRLSSFRAYVFPVLDHPALTVRTGAWVHRLIIEDGRAVGVQVEIDGKLEELRADEVVLAAGALDTPRILLLSGIGPAADLEALGIDVVADVPGVGENLHDHLLVPVIVHTPKKQIAPPQVNVPIAQVHHFTTFRAGSDAPDTQPIYFQVPMLNEGMTAPASSFSILAGLVRPESRGTFKLSSNDPHALALMDPNILARQEDMDSLIASVRECRDIARQSAIVDVWGSEEIYPGPGVDDSDEAIAAHIRATVTTYHHQVGTTRMGTDELAVVNPSTFGLNAGPSGVRIIDASVMPSVPSGNTNAPSILIGERGAEALIGSRSLTASAVTAN